MSDYETYLKKIEIDQQLSEKENNLRMEQIDGCLYGTIKLHPVDEKYFEVSAYRASISKVLYNKCVENYDEKNEDKKDSFDVFLPNIEAKVLKEIVDYMEYHKGWALRQIPFPLRSRVMREVSICEYDAKFIDRIGDDLKMLVAILIAANELDIQDLLCLCCAKIASLLKGQPPEKIAKLIQSMCYRECVIIIEFPKSHLNEIDDIKLYFLHCIRKALEILFPNMPNVVEIICNYLK